MMLASSLSRIGTVEGIIDVKPITGEGRGDGEAEEI